MFLQAIGCWLSAFARIPCPMQDQVMVKMACNVVEITATVAFGVSQLITDFI
jgi:hypothetical protein